MKLIIYLLKKLRSNISRIILNLIGKNLIYKSKLVRKNFNTLEDAEFKIYSQNGEDGIINFIVESLNIKKPNFVELGVGDYSECNTRFLYEVYYSRGLVIDCIQDLHAKISKNVSLWKGNLKIVNEFIEVKNINSIIEKNCSFQIDLFSIDLDGIDYWILNELNESIKPKIFIVEYNSTFQEKNISIPNIEKFDRGKYHYSNLCYGASLKAFNKLMQKKGYYLLGVNYLRNNAFFISNEFPKEKFFPQIKISNIKDMINANYSESRDIFKNLNFLDNKKRIKEIGDCKVIDLNKNNNLVKFKDIIDEE